MALTTVYDTGTVSLANGDTAITGVGTAFLDIGIQPGDVLWNDEGTCSVRIESVTDNNHAVAAKPWGGTSLSNAAYEIRITPPSASIAATVRALLELLNNGVLADIAGADRTDGNILQAASNVWESVTPADFVETIQNLFTGITSSGPIDISAAGAGQIKFPSVPNLSSDPNTLDFFETGTFTPIVAFGGASTGITYGTQQGAFLRLGNIVFYSLVCILTNKGSGTGAMTIGGYPYPSSSDILQSSQGIAVTNYSSVNQPVALLGSGSSSVALYSYSGSLTALTNANANNNSITEIRGFYFV
jgi:hypothetical protein